MIEKAHLRIARPTDQLSAVITFYRDGLGFQILSSFENHEGFDFGMSYHLEFTRQRSQLAGRAPTTENLLIFYLPDGDEWRTAIDRMLAKGYEPVKSRNPYWDTRGKTFEDPDGYRVVLQNAQWPER